ncbi:hypothetical protein JOF29_004704 [Kribbella aluminosa]|uniref:Peptidase M23-like protein n=1 Tax=Kribbella aluminosa TaxID=416017 RepID=A0ABS4UPR1_9ACTN|nr:phage tail tip lysozyme [Kribbella aluminosa]MBP2353594.1 hypothetical protein [Kribbella aluminosa]
MGDSKALPILSAVGLLLILPLLIVLIMLLSALGGLNTAAAQCASADQEQSLLGYPTDSHKIEVDWTVDTPDVPGHQAYDFKVAEGSKVYAASDGNVVKVTSNEIRIRRDQVETRYEYLKTTSVADGATVKRGDVIGTSGSGDEAPPGMTGAHLHFELWVDAKNDGNWAQRKPDSNPFELDPSSSSGNSCSCQGGDLSGTNNQQKVFNYLVQNGYTKEQAAGVLGNMIAESFVEPMMKEGDHPPMATKPADVMGFGGGWGLVQWTPASKMIQPSRDAGVSDDQISSLAYQLDFLKKQLLGQGPLPEKAAGDSLRAATTVEEAARAFAGDFERFGGHENPNAPTYAEREANAQHMLQLWGGAAPTADPKAAAADPCGAGSGNIAQVAKNLAWPEEPHKHWGTDPSLAKQEYVAAIAKYDGVTKDNWQSLQDPYTDCGRFVATVLRMSGADPNFPEVFTPAQKDYMLAHPEKYDHWETTPPGGMKPGDILNGPGHTYLYVGPWANGFDSAAGSLGQHVPTADNLYDVGPNGFWVFRVKGGTTPTTTPTN